MKKVFAIDPSTVATGIVVLEGDGSNMSLRSDTVVKPKTKDRGFFRYRSIATQIMELLEQEHPDVIVIEGYSLNMRNASSVVPLVELGGLLRFLMHIDGKKWLAPRASELKKFVTGKGNAPKDQVTMHVYKRWGYEAASNDLADAFGLACMGLAYASALPKITKEQSDVVRKLEIHCS